MTFETVQSTDSLVSSLLAFISVAQDGQVEIIQTEQNPLNLFC